MPQPPLFAPSPEVLPPETLEGSVERVVFANESSSWAVIRLAVGGRQETAVGPLAAAQPGELVRLTGRWIQDKKYGRQFEALSVLTLRPDTLEGLRRYLGSGMVPGIGPVMARRLVDAFGLDTLEIIEHRPERLSEVDGIGPVRRQQIREAWVAQREIQDVMIFLQAHGVSTAHAVRIFKRYGAGAVQAVREDPYRLASEIHGIGFQTADRLAARLDIARDSPVRAAAGLLFTLETAADSGHVCLPRDLLLRRAAELLEVDEARVTDGLTALVAQMRIEEEIAGRPLLYLPGLRRAEAGIADELARLTSGREIGVPIDAPAALTWLAARERVELAPEQSLAIETALDERVTIVTGGPGTGKTTLVRGLVRILTRKGLRVLLAAPTGRAAKRLAETTGLEARTIHRLLEFDPRRLGFQRHRDRPLDGDAVIVDEASMLDCTIAWHLLQAVPRGARLVLVGDVDQLPSVGPGKVLDDLIASDRLPVVRLSRVFRQAEASLIVSNAHRVNRGELPEAGAEKPSDYFFLPRQEPEEILSTLRHLVTDRVPRGFGLDPREDIQVLTPMRRGLLGATQLNLELQELLNSGGERLEAARGLRVGDRVMQVRNDYELEVFNGDIGRVESQDGDDGSVLVHFEERPVRYAPAQLDELSLAYACSVHKAQGSEYPCVILPLHTQHSIMLQRNLLYTALTRAQRLMIVVGSVKAVALAVRNARTQERFTLLTERLREEI